MEKKTNEYDLLYLTNHNDYKKVKKGVSEPKLWEDVKFYKERIVKQTMDLLNGKEELIEINNCFKNYLFLTVQHLKFTDKRDILQKEYENVKEKKKSERPFNLKNTNKMLEKREQKVGKITDKLKIKINVRNEKKMHYPQKKIINLRDKSLKTKGLEKKECEPILVESNAKTDKKNEKEKKEENAKKGASKKTTERKKKRKKKDFSKKIHK
tara:strand:+ start:533 stop:1165 length:633 start_codon:yes stop_codon:yes gene_type:complete